MFTEEYIQKTIIKDLLPCKIGDKIYTIYNSYKSFNPNLYLYTLESKTCEGFLIEEYAGELEISPAYDTWDGWCPIDHHGHGYFTDKEEALQKIKELNEFQNFKAQNEWLESL